jgi:mycofactocin system glycosyltransferase
VVLDRDVRVLDGGRVLLGGEPGRLIRLRTGADDLLRTLAGGTPLDSAARALARTLVAGGLAHPRPGPAPVHDLSVVVPVRDRAAELERCLAALGRDVPVVVVDDGSRDPQAVAEVARRHGARVVHLPVNAGPAAARNAGLAATRTPLVAFVDSDCVPAPGWLADLVGHFADARVAAVAPRVRSQAARRTLLSRYARARGPLDLGPHPARVRPGGRVGYVPTAALLVRREGLTAPFDPALRVGEDVDLVWRLHDAGWQVRYDPRTVVEHAEPDRWARWLARRHRYGTSAALLAERHPARLTPLVLPPWHTAAWLLLTAGCPLGAAAAAAVPATRLHRRLREAGLPAGTAARTAAEVTGRGVLATAAGLGGAGSVVTAPVLAALLAARRARSAATVALLAPPLLDWLARRPSVDPLRWSALRLLDDLAYASGVWRGCWTARTTRPLRPRRTRPR